MMRRAFVVGASVGVLVFLQGIVILRLPLDIRVLQLWALACSGVFGLTLSSTFANGTQAAASLAFAAVGLVLFYGTAAVILRAAYRAYRRVGVVAASVILAAIHAALYLAVIRSVVA